MKEIFKFVLYGHNLSDEQMERFASDLFEITLVNLIYTSLHRLSEGDKKQLDHSLQARDANSAISLIKTRYTQEEWKVVVDKHVYPIMESYMKEVIGVKS